MSPGASQAPAQLLVPVPVPAQAQAQVPVPVPAPAQLPVRCQPVPPRGLSLRHQVV